MNLADVMDAVASRLGDLTGLRVFGYPPPSVTPPTGIVSYPERVDYDQTYGRGMTRIPDLPVLLVVGKATERAARNKVAAWVSDEGPQSVKLALEDAAGSPPWHDLKVSSAEFDVVTIASIDYIAAMFSCEIACPGTPPS